MGEQGSTPARDVFPATAITWLDRCLERGESGRSDALRHVMEVYRLPLAIYVRGSSFVRVGEPDELVDGFFADRLRQPGYLAGWRASGRPLRRWLLTGLRHFLMEEIRRQKRGRALPLPSELSQLDDDDADPGGPFWRELGLGLVREAVRRTEDECNRDGLSAHWRVFVLHSLEGRTHAEISRLEGVDARRAAVMARTASRRFRRVLRAMVAWPGATEAEVDAELARLCEAE